jgi:hypothetical protein
VSRSDEEAIPVRLVVTFYDAFHITWRFTFAGLLVGFVVGMVWLVLRTVWEAILASQ